MKHHVTGVQMPASIQHPAIWIPEPGLVRFIIAIEYQSHLPAPSARRFQLGNTTSSQSDGQVPETMEAYRVLRYVSRETGLCMIQVQYRCGA